MRHPKRRLAAGCCLVMLAGATSVAAAPGASPGRTHAAVTDDWAMFHHDTGRDGVSADVTVGAAAMSTFHQVWAVSTGTSSFVSPAVVANPGLGRTLVYIGTQGGLIAAYDAATGARVWSVAVHTHVQSSPAVVNGYLYVGASNHRLYVLNATTGALACSFATSGVISSSPVVADPGTGPLVYFGDSGPSGNLADGGHEWAVTAEGNSAGACHLRWSFDAFGSPPGTYTGQAGSYASPAFAQDRNGRPLILFGSTEPDEAVYALDAARGTLVWRFQTRTGHDLDVGGATTISAPGVNGLADGAAYVTGKDGVLYGLDLTTGARMWQLDMTKISTTAFGSQSVASLVGGDLFTGFGGDNQPSGGMVSVDAVTGHLLWETPAGATISSPAVSGASGDQVILAADTAGTMRAYSLTGTVLWSATGAGGYFSSFGVSQGMAFIAGQDGMLRAFAP